MIWLKVCGIRRSEDAIAACRLGFNAIGLIFAESPRRVSPDQAREISRHLPSSILRVGVFSNNDAGEVKRLFQYCNLDLVQFHGDESAHEVLQWGMKAIKALRPRGSEDLDELELYANNFAVLIDTWDPLKAGGTGVVGDWTLARTVSDRTRVILAGGLRPRNVEQAIACVRPFGVDICSGVEGAMGVKDDELMRDFLSRARSAGKRRPGEDRDGKTGT